MTNWKQYKLGDFADVQTGPFGSQLHAHDYVEHGIPSIMPVNIVDHKIVEENIVRITEKDAERLRKYLVTENDIVFSRRGEIHRRALISEKENGWLCGTGCLRARFTDLEKVDPKFLYYYIGLDEVRVWLYAHAVGTSMPNLNSSILANLPINLPELPNQQKISEILSALDDKIELNRRMNQTLEQMAQTLFRQYFVDRIDADNLPEVKVQDLFNITIGRTPPRVQREWFTTEKTDVKWISIKDMGNCGVYILDTSEYLTEEAVKRFNVPVIPENTVVLSFKLTVGRVSITSERMLSNEAIAHFIPKKDTYLSPEFVYQYLKEFPYDSLGNTSSIATAVNSKTIKEMPIILPAKEKVEEFTNLVSGIFTKIKANALEIKTLTNLRDTLLPKLMSGEIDVMQTQTAGHYEEVLS